MEAERLDFEPTVREKAMRKIEGSFLNYTNRTWRWIENKKPGDSDKELLGEKRRIYEKLYNLENFRRLIYPTLDRMAGSDEEFEDILAAGANSFLFIVTRQLMDKSAIKENDYLRAFFEDGDFEYFYRRHGKLTVESIASQQAGLLNVVVDDAVVDRQKCREEVDASWDRVKDWPEKWRNKMLRPCVYYFPDQVDRYLDAVPKVIDCFNERGRADLLEYYFDLCSENMVWRGYDPKEHFPICDPEAAFVELEAFAEAFKGFEAEIMWLVKFFYGCTLNHPTFLEPLKDEKGELDENPSKFQVRIMLSGSQTKFKGDEEKIRKFLTFPQRHKALREYAILMMLCYSSVDAAFEGGIDEGAEFVIEVMPYVQIGRREYFTEFIGLLNATPKTNKKFYWELAKRIVKYLREDSLPFLNFEKFSPTLKKLFAEDPQKFQEAIEHGMNLVFNLSTASYRGDEHDSSVFEAYLLFYGDPKFEEFVAGMRLISYQAVKLKEKAPAGEPYKFSKKIAKAVNQYLAYCKQGISEAGAVLPSSNYIAIAESVVIMTLDDPEDIKENPEFGDGNIEVPNLVEGESSTEMLARTISKGTDPGAENFKMICAVSDLSMRVREDFDPRLREELRVMVDAAELSLSPDVNDHVKAVAARVNTEARQAIDLSFWRQTLVVDASEPGLKRAKDSWIFNAAPSTQLAATSGALFLALGLDLLSNDLHELGELPEGLIEALPLEKEFTAFTAGEISLRELLEAIKKKGLEKVLRANIQRVLPWVAEQIKSSRVALPGLMSVGSKIESAAGISTDDFRFVLDLAGMGDVRTTPFTLKHNRRSLVNPPLPSALEEKLLIYFFIMFGAVDPREIDMQVTIGGRLNGENAAIVGASSILSSYASVQYAPGAFEAVGFAGTEARIMVYDAGVRSAGLAFDVPNAKGRTDRLGCHSLQDITQIQLLGTFGVHRQFEGAFASVMGTYKDAFERLLAEHKLLGRLYESAWVYEDARNCDPPLYHEKMIAAFTEARRDNAALKHGTRRLMSDILGGHLVTNRAKIIRENAVDFEKLKVM